jgi:hypothetical protein
MSRLPSSKRLQYPKKPNRKIQYQSTSFFLIDTTHPAKKCADACSSSGTRGFYDPLRGKIPFISVEKYDITKKYRIKLHTCHSGTSNPAYPHFGLHCEYLKS